VPTSQKRENKLPRNCGAVAAECTAKVEEDREEMLPSGEKSVAVTGDNELLQAIQTTALQAQAFFKNSPSTMRRLLDTCADSFLACVHLARFSKVRQKEPLVLLRRPGKVRLAQAHELRIATSGSFSINARVALLHVDGGGGDASKPPRVRAAIFAPAEATTIQFTTMKPSSRRPTGTWVGRGDTKSEDCAPTQRHVHALRLLTPKQTAAVLDDVKHIGESIGWSDRGVSLPTQDVLVQNLSKESRDLVHRAIRKKILPFARRHYPHLNDAFDKQPYPCHGNLFIVRYCASSQRPGGRGLELHKDGTALTFNVCLSPEEGFTGGGTYFPANSADVDGLLVKPKPGCCLIHDGNLKHAGNEVVSGQRFILVGFYNADGHDRVGKKRHFSKAALEEQRARNLVPTPQTIYFTTAVASARGSSPAAAQGRPVATAALPCLGGGGGSGGQPSFVFSQSGGQPSFVFSQSGGGCCGSGGGGGGGGGQPSFVFSQSGGQPSFVFSQGGGGGGQPSCLVLRQLVAQPDVPAAGRGADAWGYRATRPSPIRPAQNERV